MELAKDQKARADRSLMFQKEAIALHKAIAAKVTGTSKSTKR